MNFYDIYTTLSLNPDAQPSMEKICEYCNCLNQLESLKQALWKKPNRVTNPGAFPFNEETGKIYDALWKAADAENYSTLGKVGRWMMKLIVPPADDEGMGRFHAKYHDTPNDEYHAPAKPAPQPTSPSKQATYTPSQPVVNEEPVVAAPREENEWKLEDEDKSTPQVTYKQSDVARRATSKKDD